MVGKHILPWFGGTPAVWLLCLSFYQLCLFAGYAYAHLLIERVRVARHLLIHLVLLLSAFVVLPVLPSASWKPGGDTAPTLHILAMLVSNVGFPFLALAATGPLVQAWFAVTFPGRSPYGLYAVSNVGSLLALVVYPFLVEPNLSLSAQSKLWTLGFAACGFAVLVCAWLARTAGRDSSHQSVTGIVKPEIEKGQVLFWLSLPACAVVLLMGVTNELCLDVANIPFLWIAPLAIYLLTFILSFASERFYRREIFIPLAAVVLGAAAWSLIDTVGTLSAGVRRVPIAVLASGGLAVLFTSCMLLHGELYRMRPAPARLTVFYLCVSGGGALGGLFVSLAAPLLFSEYHELRLGLAACWVLMIWLCVINRETRIVKPIVRGLAGVAFALGAVILGVFAIREESTSINRELIYQERNFFGILRVTEYDRDDPSRHLVTLRHGTTNHGSQARSPLFEDRATTYFAESTGIGFVMGQRSPQPMKVGIIGLGAGTLAAYGRRGDDYRFYEIDPHSIVVAQDERYFTYLAHCAANVEIILGDARLSLERELADGGGQGFDLLVLDAFSGDAVPAHLLTAEAFQLYMRHLSADGVLALHISNGNVDLAPLVFRFAEEFGMHAVKITNQKFVRRLHSSAVWMILNRDNEYTDGFYKLLEQRRAEMGLRPAGIFTVYPDASVIDRAPRWTDDYSDLFSVLNAAGAHRLRPPRNDSARPAPSSDEVGEVD